MSDLSTGSSGSIEPITADVRLCFVGDSFTLGAGDPTGAGWVGPVTATAREHGHQLMVYNLGIAGDTSIDISHRWLDEARRRLKDSAALGVVFAFGTNDVYEHLGRCRVPANRTLELLGWMLDEAYNEGWAALVVGPPPIADPAAAERARALCAGMAEVCRRRDVPFLDVGADLSTDAVWLHEVAAGDGSHPLTSGYQRFARYIESAFLHWLSGLWDFQIHPAE